MPGQSLIDDRGTFWSDWRLGIHGFFVRQTGSRVCGVGELMAFLKVVVSFLCFFERVSSSFRVECIQAIFTL